MCSDSPEQERAPALIVGVNVAAAAQPNSVVLCRCGLNSPIWPVNGGPARVVVYALP
jgi:hypothetical protein